MQTRGLLERRRPPRRRPSNRRRGPPGPGKRASPRHHRDTPSTLLRRARTRHGEHHRGGSASPAGDMSRTCRGRVAAPERGPEERLFVGRRLFGARERGGGERRRTRARSAPSRPLRLRDVSRTCHGARPAPAQQRHGSASPHARAASRAASSICAWWCTRGSQAGGGHRGGGAAPQTEVSVGVSEVSHRRRRDAVPARGEEVV